ncbi:phthiocerol synthesis polyketide synthase type I PpsC [Methyloglobulus morosus KoM1]|uniref:Phthiocerol synthesis polyketide synthase type I PpsC n=2 Tax=Methyloglobulus TaxID=1410680 RepID=V5DW54_9GAMM|nr:phthiocerol synthesis polyketide synthase type I PpsC [Methyloglobulus morosus KoM1]
MQIPDTMRAAEVHSGSLKSTERPVPVPQTGQVLIKVMAAGINRPDVMQRKGLYPPPPGASDIPGLEIAGIVVALGDNTNNLAIGDKVCALVTGGGYAEYCAASASLCLPIPDNLSYVEAAGIPETFFTVWSNVFDRGHLQKGETLLVHGGSSGIGTTAIQLAKAFGAKVIVTAGSLAKRQFCLDLGANNAINYREQDFVSEINQITQAVGVDLILDMIGGDYFPRNLQCLAVGGRLVQIAVQQGSRSDIDLWAVMQKRLTITGSTLRSRDDAFKADIADKLLAYVWPLLISGRIKPIIHSTFALSDAALAHELMESNQHIGKIILKVST